MSNKREDWRSNFFEDIEMNSVESLQRRRDEIERHEALEAYKAIRRSHIEEIEEENLSYLFDPNPPRQIKPGMPGSQLWPVKSGSRYWTNGNFLMEPRYQGAEVLWRVLKGRKPYESCDLTGPGWLEIEQRISTAARHAQVLGSDILKMVSFRAAYLAGRRDARASLRSIDEAAKELGVTRQRVHQILKERKDGYVPIKVGGTTLVEAEWVESLKRVEEASD